MHLAKIKLNRPPIKECTVIALNRVDCGHNEVVELTISEGAVCGSDASIAFETITLRTSDQKLVMVVYMIRLNSRWNSQRSLSLATHSQAARLMMVGLKISSIPQTKR